MFQELSTPLLQMLTPHPFLIFSPFPGVMPMLVQHLEANPGKGIKVEKELKELLPARAEQRAVPEGWLKFLPARVEFQLRNDGE